MRNVFKVSDTNIIKNLNNIFESKKLNKEKISFIPNDSTNSRIV